MVSCMYIHNNAMNQKRRRAVSKSYFVKRHYMIKDPLSFTVLLIAGNIKRFICPIKIMNRHFPTTVYNSLQALFVIY